MGAEDRNVCSLSQSLDAHGGGSLADYQTADYPAYGRPGTGPHDGRLQAEDTSIVKEAVQAHWNRAPEAVQSGQASLGCYQHSPTQTQLPGSPKCHNWSHQPLCSSRLST